MSWHSLFAGFRFIWRCQAVLGAMSFDLMATLFGGVTALMPIFARDILDIGPWGAGILRSIARHRRAHDGCRPRRAFRCSATAAVSSMSGSRSSASA